MFIKIPVKDHIRMSPEVKYSYPLTRRKKEKQKKAMIILYLSVMRLTNNFIKNDYINL